MRILTKILIALVLCLCGVCIWQCVQTVRHKEYPAVTTVYAETYPASASEQHSFDTEWIVGRTSAEIEARYGSFDILEMDYQEDGMLHDASAGYLVPESTTTRNGETVEELLVIHFNEKGIADTCKIALGNWGGGNSF